MSYLNLGDLLMEIVNFEIPQRVPFVDFQNKSPLKSQIRVILTQIRIEREQQSIVNIDFQLILLEDLLRVSLKVSGHSDVGFQNKSPLKSPK